MCAGEFRGVLKNAISMSTGLNMFSRHLCFRSGFDVHEVPGFLVAETWKFSSAKPLRLVVLGFRGTRHTESSYGFRSGFLE